MTALALRYSDVEPVAEVQSRSAAGLYRSFVSLTQLESVLLDGWVAPLVPYQSGSFSAAIDFTIDQRVKKAAKTKTVSEWKKYLLNLNSSTDVDYLSETVESLFEALGNWGVSAVDLRGLNPYQIQGEHLAAILRASSSWREGIQGWTEALEVAAQALVLQGVDPEDALYGLRDI